MSVFESVAHAPETILATGVAREAIRQTTTAPRGAAEVDFIEPRQLAIGGPAGSAALFLELGEDVISRLDTALARLTQRNEKPLVALTRQIPARFQHPSAHATARGGVAEAVAVTARDAPAGLVIFDTRDAEQGVGVVLPARAALTARRLWVCEESVADDPYAGLSEEITRHALAHAKHGRDADLEYEAVEVLAERQRDRPTWAAPGGGFGRVRAGVDLPDFRSGTGTA